MIPCEVFTGILFSRKRCGEPAVVHCGRCGIWMCKKHIMPQAVGRFLCPNCDAYENDDDWRYSERNRSWRYRSSSTDDRPPRAVGAVPLLGAGEKPGFEETAKPGESEASQGPETAEVADSGGADAPDADTGADEPDADTGADEPDADTDVDTGADADSAGDFDAS